MSRFNVNFKSMIERKHILESFFNEMNNFFFTLCSYPAAKNCILTSGNKALKLSFA